MNLPELLNHTVPPWVVLFQGELAPLSDILRQSVSAASSIYTLDGSRMHTWPALYVEFAETFQLPSYQGHNLNALDDSLSDLPLKGTSSVVIILNNAHELLEEVGVEGRQAILDLFNRICGFYGKPIKEGQTWDRPSCPFHVILIEPLGFHSVYDGIERV